MHVLIFCVAVYALSATLGAAQQPAPSQDRANRAVPKTTQAEQQMFTAYEGQNVASIEIAGQPDLKPEQYESLFVQKAGQSFSKTWLTRPPMRSKRRANSAMCAFRSIPMPAACGFCSSLNQPSTSASTSSPARPALPYSRLVQVANYPAQTPYNASEVERDRQALVTFFRQQGFFEVEVKSEVKVDAPHAIANIVFATKLGRRAKFGEVHDRRPSQR